MKPAAKAPGGGCGCLVLILIAVGLAIWWASRPASPGPSRPATNAAPATPAARAPAPAAGPSLAKREAKFQKDLPDLVEQVKQLRQEIRLGQSSRHSAVLHQGATGFDHRLRTAEPPRCEGTAKGGWCQRVATLRASTDDRRKRSGKGHHGGTVVLVEGRLWYHCGLDSHAQKHQSRDEIQRHPLSHNLSGGVGNGRRGR
jgi:hypothetical protein